MVQEHLDVPLTPGIVPGSRHDTLPPCTLFPVPVPPCTVYTHHPVPHYHPVEPPSLIPPFHCTTSTSTTTTTISITTTSSTTRGTA